MPTVTLADLQSRVYAKLDQNTLLYTNTELTNAINECIRAFNLATGMLQVTLPVETGVTVANQLLYQVPDGILIPMRIQVDDLYLQKVFANQLGKAYPTWQTDTTDTLGQPTWQWVPIGWTLFALHPADAQGGAALQMTGVAEPVLLVAPSDTVAIPAEYTQCLVDLAANVLTLKESTMLFKQSSEYFRTYLSLLKKASIWRNFACPRFYIPETAQKD